MPTVPWRGRSALALMLTVATLMLSACATTTGSGGTDVFCRSTKPLRWSKAAGIKNWGYFIIGLPTETEETIRQTIDFAKKLPLDIALFHVAAPYPGTPFFFEVVREGWFRPGTRWEQVDMDKGTVLDYPGLPAERLLYWQKRAFREWAFRPGPILTYAKMLLSDTSTFKTALDVGLQTLRWQTGKQAD